MYILLFSGAGFSVVGAFLPWRPTGIIVSLEISCGAQHSIYKARLLKILLSQVEHRMQKGRNTVCLYVVRALFMPFPGQLFLQSLEHSQQALHLHFEGGRSRDRVPRLHP